MSDDLKKLAADTADLLPQFRHGGSMLGLYLPSERAAKFKANCTDAQAIIYEELGAGSNFAFQIGMAANRLSDGPSHNNVQEAAELMLAAARAVERKSARPPVMQAPARNYVDPSRIAALKAIQGAPHDFKRLIELCREINVAAANDCHMATAMLLRAILDHVPPVFGFNTFNEVASQYGGRSFKGCAQTLQNTSRKIADMHLHGPIRAREDLPTVVQVTFSADLDVMLGEVIRLSS